MGQFEVERVLSGMVQLACAGGWKVEDFVGPRQVYADNNATTQIAPGVVSAMMPWFTDHHNPSSAYAQSDNARAAILLSRTQIGRALGDTDVGRFVFTSGATESNNMAILGTVRGTRGHIITSAVEHPAVRGVCRWLQREGYPVTEVPVDAQGRLSADEVVAAIRDDTILVTLMHANNETGAFWDIDRIAQRVKDTRPWVLFHTDATQTVGKVRIDLSGRHKAIDMLSFSGHKLHAPKGIGVIYMRSRTAGVRPLLHGGHQENGWRPGTENVPYIVGLGAAVEMAVAEMDDANMKAQKIRNGVESGILESCDNVRVNAAQCSRLPNTSSVSFGIPDGEAIVEELSRRGICASNGSACASGSSAPSYVLTAMGVQAPHLHGTVRFSFSRYNEDDEIPCIVDAVREIIAGMTDG